MTSVKQKALFLDSQHGKFVVGERDVPQPGKGELLVKVYAAALNPIDHKIQQTGGFVNKYPAILGVDIAGVVEVVGEGVQDYRKGDKVLSHGSFSNDYSGYQQYAVAVADYTAKIPPNLSFDQAATVPLGFDTAAVGLYSEQLGAGLTPPWEEGGQNKYLGNPILIMGGSSSVGSYAIQLAKLSGLSPIITTANLAHQDELKAFGATDVIDRHLTRDQLGVALHKITKKSLEIAYDVIALPETQQAAWSVLSRGGALVLTLQPVVREEEGRERTVIATYGNPHVETNKAMCHECWHVLGKWLQEGLIKPNNLEVLPDGLDGIPDGLERMRYGKISGKKLVAHPQETA